jgi:choline dehydrogenase-like flavoprotein
MLSRGTDDVEVIVVGAGAAGLGAAMRLAAARVSLKVLEARNRSGGRAYTIADGAFPLDLGCGWLHSADRTGAGSVAPDCADELMFVLNVFVLNAVFVTDREEIWLQTGTITFMHAAVAGGLKSPRDSLIQGNAPCRVGRYHRSGPGEKNPVANSNLRTIVIFDSPQSEDWRDRQSVSIRPQGGTDVTAVSIALRKG